MANKSGDAGAWMSDVQKTLAYFMSVSFVALIFVWVFKPPVMAAESMAQLNQLVSTLQTLLVMAFGFFLGSSKSSQNKDETQAKVAEKLADKVGTGNGDGSMRSAAAAAALAAPAAAAIAAPPAAAVAAPPVVNEVVPPAVETAVAAALAAREEVDKQKPPT